VINSNELDGVEPMPEVVDVDAFLSA